MFKSMKRDIFTIEVNKVALNRDNDKRISKKDRICTFVRGHKDLSWSPIFGELLLYCLDKFVNFFTICIKCH